MWWRELCACVWTCMNFILRFFIGIFFPKHSHILDMNTLTTHNCIMCTKVQVYHDNLFRMCMTHFCPFFSCVFYFGSIFILYILHMPIPLLIYTIPDDEKEIYLQFTQIVSQLLRLCSINKTNLNKINVL